MNTGSAVRDVTRQETRGSLLLWFGLLAAPAAWALQLVVNYSLEEWFACAPATQDRGEILGQSVDMWAVMVTSFSLAIALLGLGTALHCRRKLRRTDDSDSYRRARWMAVAGIFNGVLYSLAIVASYGTPLILETCQP